MVNLNSIRKTMYDVQFTRWKHLLNIKSPYSLLKSFYYIESASLFLFLSQKIIKSPNFITFLYILTGLSGAFLINVTDEFWFYIGVFLIFTKGTFDWADGPLARRLNKTSFLGYALDTYGAHVIDAFFRVSFLFYTLTYYPKLLFLIPLISFIILITKFNIYSGFLYHSKLNSTSKNIKKKENLINDRNIEYKEENKGLRNLYYNYVAFLDARARSIDFLLAILIFDRITDHNFSILLLVLSMLIVLRSLVILFGGFYLAFNEFNKI